MKDNIKKNSLMLNKIIKNRNSIYLLINKKKIVINQINYNNNKSIKKLLKKLMQIHN